MGERAHTPGRERPILFSAPMVRALLDGRKSQTRRIITAALGATTHRERDGRHFFGFPQPQEDGRSGVHYPRMPSIIGDRLWVRETWSHRGEDVWTIADARRMGDGGVVYRASEDLAGFSWFPSIFLPREFSRLTLTVTDVRVQRLQEISEEDAVAEGIEPEEGYWRDYLMPVTQICVRAADSYRTLWDSINGAGSWAANPWVAAYTFTVERRNIASPAIAAKTGGA